MSNRRKKPRLGDASMDLPFEPVGGAPIEGVADDALPSGGVTVGSTVTRMNGHSYPGLLFRFSDPHGNFYRPMLLVLDDDQIEKLPGLVAQAVEYARQVAKGDT